METLLLQCWLPVAGGRATAWSLCLQAVGGGLSGLAAQFSDESALKVCVHVYMRYKIDVYTLLFFTFLTVIVQTGTVVGRQRRQLRHVTHF